MIRTVCSGLVFLACSMQAYAISIGEAVNQPSWTWTTGGQNSWTGQTAISHDGVASAQSGAITHLQTSWVETVVSGPGLVACWWKVSSETNWDYANLYVNGQRISRLSGEVDWQQALAPLPAGSCTVRWDYVKDGVDSAGDDMAWLDEVCLTNGFLWAPGPFTTGEGQTISLSVIRHGSLAGSVVVDYFTSNGTALAGTDYVDQTGTLVFTAGIATQTVQLTTLAPGLAAGIKNFSVGLRNPALGGVTAPPVAITIYDRLPIIDYESEDMTNYIGDSAWLWITAGQFNGINSALDCDWFEGQAGDTHKWLTNTLFSSGWGDTQYSTDPYAGTTTYWARLNNPFGAATSRTIVVTKWPQITAAITTEPADATIYEGDSAWVSVEAIGGGLAFHWYAGVAGDTNQCIRSTSGGTYSSISTQALYNTTSFWVLVTNQMGAATSRTALITVQPCVAPSITWQTADRTILEGESTFEQVDATGGKLTFLWYGGALGDTNDFLRRIDGQNWSTYNTPDLYTSTSYWALVTNIMGAATSQLMRVTVMPMQAPIILNEPSDQAIAEGEQTDVYCQASGGKLWFHWYSGTAGDTNHQLRKYSSSAYSAWDLYTTPALYATTSYWVLVTNTLGAATSRTATITVAQPEFPGFIGQPSGGTIYVGDTYTMWAAATGGTLTLVYYGGEVGDTNNPVRTVTGGMELYTSFTTPQLYAGTTYWVRVSNPLGVITSQAAVVEVLPMEAPHITGGPDDRHFNYGESGYNYITAYGGSILYRWFRGMAGDQSTPILTTSNGLSSYLSIDPITISTCYWVLASNPMGTVTSRTAWVRVNGDVQPYGMSMAFQSSALHMACPTEPMAEYVLERSPDLQEWFSEGYHIGDGAPWLIELTPEDGVDRLYYRLRAW